MGRSTWWSAFCLTMFCLVSDGPVVAGADISPLDTPHPVTGQLRVVSYRASAFGHGVSGAMLWLTGPDELLRLEIRSGGGASLQALLAQQGTGWTAVFSGDGASTLNRWGEGWQRPPPGMAEAARLVSMALLRGPPPLPDRSATWRAGRPTTPTTRQSIGRLVRPESRTASGYAFRRDQAARGLGRGGNGESLVLDWPGTADDHDPRLRVRSSRRPGQVELATEAELAVDLVMPEAFVPLWPLAQLITILDAP